MRSSPVLKSEMNIEQVSEVKYRGVELDSQLKIVKHVKKTN